MKREEILARLGFAVGAYKKKRVIIISDIKTEADDPFAIVHHLLSPTEDVRGIVACHWETKLEKSPSFAAWKGTTTQQSYEEGEKILDLMGIDDVPLVRGARYPLAMGGGAAQESDGAKLIIAEAMKEEEAPLFIACQGAMTDLAIALERKPEIAAKMTAILIAGAPYPEGGQEPNIEEDVKAAQSVFASELPLWQIPEDVYGKTILSLAEVVDKVKPCGKIGAYLCEEMLAVNDFYAQAPIRMPWPHGETWSIGDNPTATVLLLPDSASDWEERRAPLIGDDMRYQENPKGRMIRVYRDMDNRLGMSDFFSKLRLCYAGR